MIVVDAVLALLVVLVLGNYWLGRSVLYPPFLFCGMWILDLSLYCSWLWGAFSSPPEASWQCFVRKL
jgi:hypothetical protein